MLSAIASLVAVFWALSTHSPTPAGVCLSAEEAELVRLVNEYRVANGRVALPASYWLSTTAQWHGWDLTNNNPVTAVCNLHSWSTAMPALWQAVCYTPDHAQAAQMWGKPGQISSGRYVGAGYENAVVANTAASALAWWQSSPAHNAVILQQGIWAGVNFTGLGTGFNGSFGLLWFGDGADPDGVMYPCAGIFSDGFE